MSQHCKPAKASRTEHEQAATAEMTSVCDLWFLATSAAKPGVKTVWVVGGLSTAAYRLATSSLRSAGGGLAVL
jgi:hypothetical protein